MRRALWIGLPHPGIVIVDGGAVIRAKRSRTGCAVGYGAEEILAAARSAG